MPLVAMLHFLIAIGFVLHANRTGRPQVWMYILIFLPLIGSVAYVLFELLPELANTRRARKVATDVRTLVNPDRDFRQLGQRLQDTDSVDAKCKFAQECERKGMWAEAIELYQQSAQGVYADDPEILRGLARAELGSGNAGAALSTLARLRMKHPDYQNQDAHLTYARALEAQDRLREADAEYRSLCEYYIGLEARTRYALLLQRLGETTAARQLFDHVVRASKVRGTVLTPDDQDWLRVARKNI